MSQPTADGVREAVYDAICVACDRDGEVDRGNERAVLAALVRETSITWDDVNDVAACDEIFDYKGAKFPSTIHIARALSAILEAAGVEREAPP